MDNVQSPPEDAATKNGDLAAIRVQTQQSPGSNKHLLEKPTVLDSNTLLMVDIKKNYTSVQATDDMRSFNNESPTES